MLKAFAALDETEQNSLKDNLHALIAHEQRQRLYMVVASEVTMKR
jgi:hypothetical protein